MYSSHVRNKLKTQWNIKSFEKILPSQKCMCQERSPQVQPTEKQKLQMHANECKSIYYPSGLYRKMYLHSYPNRNVGCMSHGKNKHIVHAVNNLEALV
jgi:hypothetical protein